MLAGEFLKRMRASFDGVQHARLRISSSLDNVIHVIQVALTPVFLLTALAALLNSFQPDRVELPTELDQVRSRICRAHLRPMLSSCRLDLTDLRRRSIVLDVAVVLATIAGVATCGAALVLFVGALGAAVVRSLLFVLFGGALLFAIAALFAFAVEMMMAGRGLRAIVRSHQKRAADTNRDQRHNIQ